MCLRPRNNDRSFVRRLSLVSTVECRRLSSDGVMARVGSCDAAPLSASRASSYVPSLLPPAPPIWTVHGTLSPSYAVGGALYGGLPGPTPTVVSLSDTRPTTTSLGSQSPAQHAYYEITVSTAPLPLVVVLIRASLASDLESACLRKLPREFRQNACLLSVV